jgi:nitroreductase
VDLDAAIARRRMCRQFLDRPVPPETVDRLIARAGRAPSAGHTQGWDWLVLEGTEQTSRFWALDADPAWLAAPDHPGLLRAPVIVIPLAGRAAYERRYAEVDKQRRGPALKPVVTTGGHEPSGERGQQAQAARRRGTGPGAWDVPYWLTDVAFATMLLLLGAVDEGLGALFFALHGDPRRTVSALGVPADRDPLGAVALGWPDPDARPGSSARRPRRALGDQIHRGGW